MVGELQASKEAAQLRLDETVAHLASLQAAAGLATSTVHPLAVAHEDPSLSLSDECPETPARHEVLPESHIGRLSRFTESSDGFDGASPLKTSLPTHMGTDYTTSPRSEESEGD